VVACGANFRNSAPSFCVVILPLRVKSKARTTARTCTGVSRQSVEKKTLLNGTRRSVPYRETHTRVESHPLGLRALSSEFGPSPPYAFRFTAVWTLPNAVLHRVRTSAQPENHFRGSPSIRSFSREWVKLRLELSADLSPTRLRVMSRVLTKLEMRILTHKLSLHREIITFL
jgi:hypothetical protein